MSLTGKIKDFLSSDTLSTKKQKEQKKEQLASKAFDAKKGGKASRDTGKHSNSVTPTKKATPALKTTTSTGVPKASKEKGVSATKVTADNFNGTGKSTSQNGYIKLKQGAGLYNDDDMGFSNLKAGSVRMSDSQKGNNNSKPKGTLDIIKMANIQSKHMDKTVQNTINAHNASVIKGEAKEKLKGDITNGLEGIGINSPAIRGLADKTFDKIKETPRKPGKADMAILSGLKNPKTSQQTIDKLEKYGKKSFGSENSHVLEVNPISKSLVPRQDKAADRENALADAWESTKKSGARTKPITVKSVNGKAPKGLYPGDKVVTNAGTYTIKAVLSDGSYITDATETFKDASGKVWEKAPDTTQTKYNTYEYNDPKEKRDITYKKQGVFEHIGDAAKQLLNDDSKSKEYKQKQAETYSKVEQEFLNDKESSKYTGKNHGLLSLMGKGTESEWSPKMGLLSSATQMQKDMYNYTYAKHGKKAANEYLESLEYTQLNPKNAENVQKMIETDVKSNPVMASIASVGANTALPQVAAVRNAIQGVKNATGMFKYKPIDANDSLNAISSYGSKVRGAVSEKIKNPALRVGYNAVMSMADMAAQTATLGGAGSNASKFVTLSMSTVSANDTVLDTLSRGGTQQQAFINGLMNGALEYVSESPAVEGVFNVGRGIRPVKDVKSFAISTLRQMGIEAGGEGFANITQNLADQIIMGNKSNFGQTVKYYEQEGKSHKEAVKQATMDMYVKQTAEAMATGALAGGAMGGAASAFNTASAGRNINSNTAYAKDLARTANEIGLGGQYAETAKEINKGHNVSSLDAANLKGAIQDYYQKKTYDDIARFYNYVGLEAPHRLATAFGKASSRDETGYNNQKFTDAWLDKSTDILMQIEQYKADPKNTDLKTNIKEYLENSNALLYSGVLSEDGQFAAAVRARANEIINGIPASAAGQNIVSNDSNLYAEDTENANAENNNADIDTQSADGETSNARVAAQSVREDAAPVIDITDDVVPLSESASEGAESNNTTTEKVASSGEMATQNATTAAEPTVESAAAQSAISEIQPVNVKEPKSEPKSQPKKEPKSVDDYTVGQKKGSTVTYHKSAEVENNSPLVKKAIQAIGLNLDYDLVREEPRNRKVTFIKVDDFDGYTEPTIESELVVTFNKEGELKEYHENEYAPGRIIPDKSEYVPLNYTGFDVAAQKAREDSWKNALDDKGEHRKYESSRISNPDYFYDMFGDIVSRGERSEDISKSETIDEQEQNNTDLNGYSIEESSDGSTFTVYDPDGYYEDEFKSKREAEEYVRSLSDEGKKDNVDEKKEVKSETETEKESETESEDISDSEGINKENRQNSANTDNKTEENEGGNKKKSDGKGKKSTSAEKSNRESKSGTEKEDGRTAEKGRAESKDTAKEKVSEAEPKTDSEEPAVLKARGKKQQSAPNKDNPLRGSLNDLKARQNYGKTDEAIRSIKPENRAIAENIGSIIKEIGKTFHVNIYAKRYRNMGRNTLGWFDNMHSQIHTQEKEQLGITIHELGHKLDKDFGLNGSAGVKDMLNGVPGLKQEMEQRGYSPEEMQMETIADFVWKYLSEPDIAWEMGSYARNRNFYETFELALDKKTLKDIKAIRADILAFTTKNTTERMRGQVRTREEVRAEDRLHINDLKTPAKALDKLRDGFDKAYGNFQENFIDSTWAASKVVKDIEKASGRKLTPKENLQLALEFSGSNASVTDTLITRGFIKPNGELTGRESFADIIKATEEKGAKAGRTSKKNAFNDFALYLIARQSIDRERMGQVTMSQDATGGDNIAAYEQLIRDMDSKYGDLFEKQSDAVYEWYDAFMRSWMVETGLLTEEKYEMMRNMYPHYVPMFRVMDTRHANGQVSKGVNPLKHNSLKGSTREIYNPIENIMIQVNNIVKAYHNNEVAATIHRLWTSEDAAVQSGIAQFVTKEEVKLQKQQVDTTEIKGRLENKVFKHIFNDVWSAEQRGEWSRMSDEEKAQLKAELANRDIIDDVIDDTITQFVPTDNGLDKDVVVALIDGEKHYYRILDEYLAQAITAVQPTEYMFKHIAKLTRVFSALTTSQNPIFAISNAIRDFQHGWVYTDAEHWYQNFTYPVEWTIALGQALKNEFSSKHQSDMYKQYKSTTGFDHKYMADSDTLGEVMKNIHRSHNPLVWAAHFIDALNTAVEAAPRLVAYKRKFAVTNNVMVSGKAGRESTVNFDRKGAKTKRLGQAVPFLGAAVAGVNQFVTLLTSKETWTTKNGRLKLARAFATQAIPAVLLAFINSGWFGDDDDKRKEYDELSEYTKNNYWVFKWGDTWVKLPRDREISALFGTLFQNIVLDKIYPEERDSTVTKEFIGYLKDQLMPTVSPVGWAFIQARNNKTWYGSDLISYSEQDLLKNPETYMDIADESTSELAVWMAGIINKGPEAMREALGVLGTPKGVDYVFDQLTGGLGDVVLPLTTPAERWAGLGESLKAKYTFNEDKSSRYTSEAYDIKDKLTALEKVDRITDEEKEWLTAFSKTMSKSSGDDPDYKTVGDYFADIRAYRNDLNMSYSDRAAKMNKAYEHIAEMTYDLVRAYKGGGTPQGSYAEKIIPSDIDSVGFTAETYTAAFNRINKGDKSAKKLALASNTELTDEQKEYLSEDIVGVRYDGYAKAYKKLADAGVTAEQITKAYNETKDYDTDKAKALSIVASGQDNAALLAVAIAGTSDDKLDSMVKVYQNAVKSGVTAEMYDGIMDSALTISKAAGKKGITKNGLISACKKAGYSPMQTLYIKQLYNSRWH